MQEEYSVQEVEIGIGKSGRRGYSFDELTILPSRRTRDADQVDVSWQLDAYRFEIPVIAAPLDGVTSPGTAAAMGRLGGVGALNLEGLWTRHEDPTELLERAASLLPGDRVVELRDLYKAPVRTDLVSERIRQIRESGETVCVSVSPANTESLLPHITAAEPDLLLIQSTVTSADHVSQGDPEPLDLKNLVRRLSVPVVVGGCASFPSALHLMRTGAAGVLVGVGSGRTAATRDVLGVGGPQATAISDARAARMRHLDETGVYCHVISDGGMSTAADIAKAVVCGADAVMLGAPLAQASEAPANGTIWSMSGMHKDLPRGMVDAVETRGDLERILFGPADRADGGVNLIGGLRKAMALTGYGTLKEFQKADLTVSGGTSR